jgi:hypothetical protein
VEPTDQYERMLMRSWRAASDAHDLAERACRWNHARRLRLAMKLAEECQADLQVTAAEQRGISAIRRDAYRRIA